MAGQLTLVGCKNTLEATARRERWDGYWFWNYTCLLTSRTYSSAKFNFLVNANIYFGVGSRLLQSQSWLWSTCFICYDSSVKGVLSLTEILNQLHQYNLLFLSVDVTSNGELISKSAQSQSVIKPGYRLYTGSRLSLVSLNRLSLGCVTDSLAKETFCLCNLCSVTARSITVLD